jgi:hypothetical protein
MNHTDWPREPWRSSVADYSIRCVVHKEGQSLFTVVVEEDGEELRRETITGTDSEALGRAQELRESLDAHIRQKQREERLRRLRSGIPR